MTTLGELAKVVRSKNAGPFIMTIDIMFPSKEIYDKVITTGFFTTKLFSDLYNIKSDLIKIYYYDIAHTIKISMPRPFFQGDICDGDNYAGQQYGPLVLINIPI
ncbi:MAG: DUF4387 domain-containing protein [Candidatus Lokiarchaeota archaeon]|nr:DUF4387 domain-containing protein [Candidatus Lokiarchaeota archaeon]